jgi:prepilin-type processing-associated H-X9-DG protein
MRHFMRANTWFADGHVSTINISEALGFGVTAIAVDSGAKLAP